MSLRQSLALVLSLSAVAACGSSPDGDLFGPQPDASNEDAASGTRDAAGPTESAGDGAVFPTDGGTASDATVLAADATAEATPDASDSSALDATDASTADVSTTDASDASAPDVDLPDVADANAWDASPPDAADASAPAHDAGVPPCTWYTRFEELYGHAWNVADVGFVTTTGVARGIDKLDMEAQRNQVPSYVLVKGGGVVTGIQLFAPGSNQAIASRTDAKYVYGLGHAMWLEINAYGDAGLTAMTLLRQFGMEEPTYNQLTAALRVLTKNAEIDVPAADLSEFRGAAAAMMAHVQDGSLPFAIGTGHAIDFENSSQSVNGKSFAFQFSNSYGLDVQLGFEGNGWGPKWRSIADDGSWSATNPGMQPICGGCARDTWNGRTYVFCQSLLPWSSAESACVARGGHLAATTDAFVESFARQLSPNAGDAWIGLSSTGTAYAWSSGAPLAYTDWNVGQPSASGTCAAIARGSLSDGWSTSACTQSKAYLCTIP